MNVFWPSHSSRPTRLLIGLQATPKGHIASMNSGYSTESRFWNSYRVSTLSGGCISLIGTDALRPAFSPRTDRLHGIDNISVTPLGTCRPFVSQPR